MRATSRSEYYSFFSRRPREPTVDNYGGPVSSRRTSRRLISGEATETLRSSRPAEPNHSLHGTLRVREPHLDGQDLYSEVFVDGPLLCR